MKPKLLSWNARWLNKGDKRLRIRNLIGQWKVDINCLQESKLELILSSVVSSLWGSPHVEWCCLASTGALSGILLRWDRRVVENVEECVGEYFVAFSFRNVEYGFSWAFAGVYGPNSDCD